MYDLEQEYNNLNIQQPSILLENTDQKIFLQIQKIQEEFAARFMKHSGNSKTMSKNKKRKARGKEKKDPQTQELITVKDANAFTDSAGGKAGGGDALDVNSKRFLTIIETFNNIGDIMKIGQTVVTNPKYVCQTLVNEIINHKILDCGENSIESLDELEKALYEDDNIDPKDQGKLLPRGFYFKSFYEDEEEKKTEELWKLLEVTGLGLELSEIKMFIPLLISEGCNREMQCVAGLFHRSMKSKKFNMTARFDVETFKGNGVELFHKLCFKVVQRCKLELCYSRNIEKRTKDCWVSSCHGHLSSSRLAPFLISQYQECERHECYNTFIIQVSSDKPEDISEASNIFQSCVEEAVSDLGGKTRRFIRFGKHISAIKNILNTKPEDFVTKADNVPMSIEDFQREIQKFIENSHTAASENSKKDEEKILMIDNDAVSKNNNGSTFIFNGNVGTIGCVGGQNHDVQIN